MKINTHTIMVVDTETIDLSKRFIYDIGYIIANREEKLFKVYEEHSFLVKQVFDNKILFHTAYYAKKKPKYTKLLKGRKIKRKYFGHILRFMEKNLKENEIVRIYAYNSPFDKKGFAYNVDYFGTKDIFKGIGWYDILAIANNFIHNTKEYNNYCIEHNYLTPRGNLKVNAEITYGFITENKEYIEEHTGLEDCKIELDILNYCIEKGYDFKHYRRKNIKAIKDTKALDI